MSLPLLLLATTERSHFPKLLYGVSSVTTKPDTPRTFAGYTPGPHPVTDTARVLSMLTKGYSAMWTLPCVSTSSVPTAPGGPKGSVQRRLKVGCGPSVTTTLYSPKFDSPLKRAVFPVTSSWVTSPWRFMKWPVKPGPLIRHWNWPLTLPSACCTAAQPRWVGSCAAIVDPSLSTSIVITVAPPPVTRVVP